MVTKSYLPTYLCDSSDSSDCSVPNNENRAKKIKQSFSGATFGKKTEQKQSILTKKKSKMDFFLLTASEAQQKSLKNF